MLGRALVPATRRGGDPHRDRLPRPLGRALPRLRRALERGRPARPRGGELRRRGPFEEDERAFIPLFVPPWGYHPRDDATYFPMPWLLSTAGYGVLVDNAETSLHRLASESPGAWSVEVEALELRLRVFAGPRPADVVRRLSERVGRQPEPDPYVFGLWYQPRDDEQAILARRSRPTSTR